MARLAKVYPHLTLKQLKGHFRDCPDPVEKTHWQVIWLRAQGETTAKVAAVCGCNVDWVRRLVRRYNEFGPESLGDMRRYNPGQKPYLDDEQRAELLCALCEPAPDGGLWNGAKVAKWIEDRVGHPVQRKRGWVYLRDLGLTCKTPRPRHNKSSTEEQAAFKKNCDASF